jgi:ABC-2 type transport system ATP-binding protein
LRSVDLDVQHGETVGLIGHNGSGKSTLLKCVAGIMRPTEGRIRKHGRMAALLELGSGFHPDLTGRENVFMNGSILGLSKAEITRIFDEIVAFADVEAFIDNQVKHYSSGMQARLGFAVAVNVDPEILLVDEVLAVGDESFQQKCLERIRRFQDEGRAIMLVSHSPDLVRQMCDRVAVLDQGVLLTMDTPGAAVLAFRESLLRRDADAGSAALAHPGWHSNLDVEITGVTVEYPDPDRHYVTPEETLRIRLGYSTAKPVRDVVFRIEIHDQDGNLLLGTTTRTMDVDVGCLDGKGDVVFRLDTVPLLDGVYPMGFAVASRAGVNYDVRAEQDVFEVMTSGWATGRVHLPLTISVEPATG